MPKNLAALTAQKIIYDYLKTEQLELNKKLPTQKELEKKYYVSRTTILKAIEILRRENLVYSIQGCGMFFTDDRLSLYLCGIYSYDYQLLKQGIEIENILLSTRIIKATRDLAMKLNVLSGTPVIEIIRKKVNRKNGQELILQCNYLNYNRFSEIDFEKLNHCRLYAVLGQDFNLRITNANEIITVKPIKNTDQKYLTSDLTHVLNIERTSYEDEQIVEFTRTYILSADFEYKVKLNILS